MRNIFRRGTKFRTFAGENAMAGSYINIHTHRPAPDCISPTQAGVHPWHALDSRIDTKALERAQMIGEIGLDYAADVDRHVQRTVFEEQLAAALRLKKPVLLHCVRAFEPTMRILSRYDIRAVVFHGFIGSVQQAAAAVARGYRLSFGMRTFSSPKTMLALRSIPSEAIFCETDDDPVDIGEVYRRVAEVRCTEVADLIRQIEHNYEKLMNGNG